MKIIYNLGIKPNSGILWGGINSDFFYNDIKKCINDGHDGDDEILHITFNFINVHSLDISFINEVFIKLVNDYKETRKVTFIFGLIEHDAIHYYLNRSFTDNDLIEYIKYK